jgi:hypothetical protein
MKQHCESIYTVEKHSNILVSPWPQIFVVLIRRIMIARAVLIENRPAIGLYPNAHVVLERILHLIR